MGYITLGRFRSRLISVVSGIIPDQEQNGNGDSGQGDDLLVKHITVVGPMSSLIPEIPGIPGIPGLPTRQDSPFASFSPTIPGSDGAGIDLPGILPGIIPKRPGDDAT